jgi:hypothetical protein
MSFPSCWRSLFLAVMDATSRERMYVRCNQLLHLLQTTQRRPITQRHCLNEPALAPLVVLHIAE